MNLNGIDSSTILPGTDPAPVSASYVAKRSTRWPEIRARSFQDIAAVRGAAQNLLSRTEQEHLRAIATEIKFRRGREAIYSEGEEAHSIYIIDNGIVRISRCSENGRRQILAFRMPGDVFGLPESGRYVNSADTICATRVFRCPWSRVQKMILLEPELQLKLLSKILSDFRRAQNQIMMLGQQNIYQRLASFLLDLIGFPEFFDEAQSRLKLPVNRFDLADYLGSAAGSTARAFGRLENEGLLRRINPRTIEVLDINGLQNLRSERRRGSCQPVSEPSQGDEQIAPSAYGLEQESFPK